MTNHLGFIDKSSWIFDKLKITSLLVIPHQILQVMAAQSEGRLIEMFGSGTAAVVRNSLFIFLSFENSFLSFEYFSLSFEYLSGCCGEHFSFDF